MPPGDRSPQESKPRTPHEAVAVFLRPLAELPDPLPIPTLAQVRRAPAFDVSITPPGSKSLTNRALLLASLADGDSVLHGPLTDADDARQMLRAIEMLGASVQADSDGTLRVRGVGGRWRVPPEGVSLHLENAGTAVRFLAGASLLSPHPITIDGNARMRERPIAELGDLLRAIGATVEYLGSTGCPPLRITPATDPARSLSVGQMRSSQFLSALLLVAPWLPHGLTVKLTAAATSASYVSMTTGLLAGLGATIQTSADERVIRISPHESGRGLPAFTYDVEPDASGATYFWAAAALIPGAVCCTPRLDTESLQGDALFPRKLSLMGARVLERKIRAGGIEVYGPRTLSPVLADMSDMPDAAMTLAAVACFARGTSVLRGLSTLRDKETDRIQAIITELARAGVSVTATPADPNALTISPPTAGPDCSPAAPRIEFETYNDHRMAMSMALLGLRRPNVFIKNPGCVAKTYPTFWREFAALYGVA